MRTLLPILLVLSLVSCKKRSRITLTHVDTTKVVREVKIERDSILYETSVDTLRDTTIIQERVILKIKKIEDRALVYCECKDSVIKDTVVVIKSTTIKEQPPKTKGRWGLVSTLIIVIIILFLIIILKR